MKTELYKIYVNGGLSFQTESKQRLLKKLDEVVAILNPKINIEIKVKVIEE